MAKFSLISKKNKKLLSDPLDDNNPITVQVLGICSALAITVKLKPAVVMAISVLAVLTIIFTLAIPSTVIGTFYGMNVNLPGGLDDNLMFLGTFTNI